MTPNDSDALRPRSAKERNLLQSAQDQCLTFPCLSPTQSPCLLTLWYQASRVCEADRRRRRRPGLVAAGRVWSSGSPCSPRNPPRMPSAGSESLEGAAGRQVSVRSTLHGARPPDSDQRPGPEPARSGWPAGRVLQAGLPSPWFKLLQGGRPS